MTRSSCSWLTSGPTCVLGVEAAAPASCRRRAWRARRRTRRAASPRRRAACRRSTPAPWLKKTPISAPCTAVGRRRRRRRRCWATCRRARARRASACSAVSRWISLPTSVEPVNAILSTSGCRTSAPPAVGPKPGTMLTTPSGTPASSSSSPRRSAVSGVCSAGFSTHGVAARERRPELPRRHQEREVPRDDLPAHADRLAQRVVEEGRVGRDWSRR